MQFILDQLTKEKDRVKPPFLRRFSVIFATGGTLLGVYYVSHLDTVPITGKYRNISVNSECSHSIGRRRFIDITPRQEAMIAHASYNAIVNEVSRRADSDDITYACDV
jgi:hypothetical protein